MTTQFQVQMGAPAILQHEARKKFEKEQEQQQQQEQQQEQEEQGQGQGEGGEQQQQDKMKDKDKDKNKNKDQDKERDKNKDQQEQDKSIADKDKDKDKDKLTKDKAKEKEEQTKQEQQGQQQQQPKKKQDKLDKLEEEEELPELLAQVKEQDQDQNRNRNRSQDRDRDRNQERGKNRNQERDRDRNQEQDKNFEQTREKKKGKTATVDTSASTASAPTETETKPKTKTTEPFTEDKGMEDTKERTDAIETEDKYKRQWDDMDIVTDTKESLDFSTMMNLIISIFYLFKRQVWKPLGFVSQTSMFKRLFPQGFYYDRYLKPVIRLVEFRSRWRLFFVDRILYGMRDFAKTTIQDYVIPPIKEHIRKLQQIDGVLSFFRYIADITMDMIVFAFFFPVVMFASMLYVCVWTYRQYLKFKKSFFRMFF